MLNRESQGSLPLPDLSRKIEGPLLAGYSHPHDHIQPQQELNVALFNFTLLGQGAAQTILTGPHITREFILGKPS